MIKITIWAEAHEDDQDIAAYPIEGDAFSIDVERTDTDEIAIHHYQDGYGSVLSDYLSRESAIELARRLLNEAKLR